MGLTSEYIMAGDEELSRLSSQHGVIKDAMGGLLLAPVDFSASPLRVLDSATADGTWLQDFCSTYPSTPGHTVVGTDIDDTKFPKSPPVGTSFQLQDINRPWPETWQNSFDLVHQRLALAAAGPNGQSAVKNLVSLVKVGGWIQLIEAENILSDREGPVMHDFVNMMKDCFRAIGTPLTLSQDLRIWLQEAGMVDIQEILIDVQMGASNPKPKLAKQGAYSTPIAAASLSGFAKTLPQSALSISPERLDSLAEELKAELLERGGGYPLRAVCARKPEL